MKFWGQNHAHDHIWAYASTIILIYLSRNYLMPGCIVPWSTKLGYLDTRDGLKSFSNLRKDCERQNHAHYHIWAYAFIDILNMHRLCLAIYHHKVLVQGIFTPAMDLNLAIAFKTAQNQNCAHNHIWAYPFTDILNMHLTYSRHRFVIIKCLFREFLLVQFFGI